MTSSKAPPSATPGTQTAPLLGLVAVYALLVLRYWFVCDDAFIAFRYGRNLAEGQGWTYNPGEPAEEGFSSTLWVLISAAAESLSLDPVLVLPALSAICALVVVLAGYHLLIRRLGLRWQAAWLTAAFVALTPSMAVWATSGLETMLWTGLVLGLSVEVVLPRRNAALAVVLAAALVLVRVEGVAWVVWIAAIGSLGPELRSRKVAGIAAATGVFAFAALAAWRLETFGTLVSNTALVKARLGAYTLSDGVPYVVVQALTLPAVAAALGLSVLSDSVPERVRPLAWIAAGFPVFALAIGGDHFAFGRVLVPMVPLLAIPMGCWIDAHWDGWRTPRTAVIGVWIAASVPAHLGQDFLSDGARHALHFRMDGREPRTELEHWAHHVSAVHTGRGLATAIHNLDLPEETTMVAYKIGTLGYDTRLRIRDGNGLVTRAVAERVQDLDEAEGLSPGHKSHVDRDWFIRQADRPDILVARRVAASGPEIRETLGSLELTPLARSLYQPELHPQADGSALLVLRRSPPGASGAAAWESLQTIARAGPGKGTLQAEPGSWNLDLRPTDEAAMLDVLGYQDGEQPAPLSTGVVRHDLDRAQPGRNLYISGHGPEATLMEMDGTPLHRWRIPWSVAFEQPPRRSSAHERLHWRRIRIEDDGTIFVIQEYLGVFRATAQGEVVWSRPNGAHHDLFRHGDELWMLARREHVIDRRPIREDFVEVLSATDGTTLRRFSVRHAVSIAPFPKLRAAFEASKGSHAGDELHTNTLWRVGPESAGEPPWSEGTLLLSSRYLDAIFTLDPDNERVTWMHRGSFTGQHDPRTIAGTTQLLLLDNGPDETASSGFQVLDRGSGAVLRSWYGTPEEPFWTRCCGTAAPLANGNILLTETTGGRALEVAENGDVVWEFVSPHRAQSNPAFVASLYDVLRLPADFGDAWIDPKTVSAP